MTLVTLKINLNLSHEVFVPCLVSLQLHFFVVVFFHVFYVPAMKQHSQLPECTICICSFKFHALILFLYFLMTVLLRYTDAETGAPVYFGYLMPRGNSLEKILMLGKIEGKR